MAYTNNSRDLDALKRRKNAICKGVADITKGMEIAIAVVRTFDGKQLNKRLSTAIQNEIDNKMGKLQVHVSLEYDYNGKATLVFGLYQRSYQNPADSNGVHTCSYFDGEIYGHVYTDALGRVEADKIVPALENAIKYNKRTAYKYTDAVKNFSKDLAKYEKALEAFRKVYNSLNPLLIDRELSSYMLTKGHGYPRLSEWEEKREKALNF